MSGIVTGMFERLTAQEIVLLRADLERLCHAHACDTTRLAQLLEEPETVIAQLVTGSLPPTRDLARKVRALASRMAHNSLAAWKQRICASNGYELLIDRTLTIIAVNGASPGLDRSKPPSPIGPHLFLGRHYNEILPSLDCTLIETQGNGIEDLHALGFFDGHVRCVRFCAEINAGPFVRTGVHEFWPIATEDAGIVAHSILHRNNMPRVLTAPGVYIHWREVVPALPADGADLPPSVCDKVPPQR